MENLDNYIKIKDTIIATGWASNLILVAIVLAIFGAGYLFGRLA